MDQMDRPTSGPNGPTNEWTKWTKRGVCGPTDRNLLLEDGDAVLEHLVRLQEAQRLEVAVRRLPPLGAAASLSHSLHPTPRRRAARQFETI